MQRDRKSGCQKVLGGRSHDLRTSFGPKRPLIPIDWQTLNGPEHEHVTSVFTADSPRLEALGHFDESTMSGRHRARCETHRNARTIACWKQRRRSHVLNEVATNSRASHETRFASSTGREPARCSAAMPRGTPQGRNLAALAWKAASAPTTSEGAETRRTPSIRVSED